MYDRSRDACLLDSLLLLWVLGGFHNAFGSAKESINRIDRKLPAKPAGVRCVVPLRTRVVEGLVLVLARFLSTLAGSLACLF